MSVNKKAISRLSRYRNTLKRLSSRGFVKIFSDNLADAIGVKASQVRKDFSMFGITGNKKAGYNVETLLEKISGILGKNERQKIVIVGYGRIGAALLEYSGFDEEGIEVVACFDINHSKVNRGAYVPILPMEEVGDFIRQNEVKVAIITVPDYAAQHVFDTLLGAGIKGVLNFAPLRLASEGVEVHNINIAMEIEGLFYFINKSLKGESSLI